MVTIYINEPDAFFQLGLKSCLTQIFSERYRQQVHFLRNIKSDTAQAADLIIISLSRRDIPGYLMNMAAYRHSVILGIVDEAPHELRLPCCANNIQFIHRHMPLTAFRGCICQNWEQQRYQTRTCFTRDCRRCQGYNISRQQRRVLEGMRQGKNLSQIAEEMQIKARTAYSHKYSLMKKFDLRSTYDLTRFLQSYSPCY